MKQNLRIELPSLGREPGPTEPEPATEPPTEPTPIPTGELDPLLKQAVDSQPEVKPIPEPQPTPEPNPTPEPQPEQTPSPRPAPSSGPLIAGAVALLIGLGAALLSGGTRGTPNTPTQPIPRVPSRNDWA